MITTNLTGNLGNHMWQYAVCRCIAEKLGYRWGINPSPSHDYFNGKSQMYFMNVDFGDQDFHLIQHQYFEPWLTHNHVDQVNITMYDPNLLKIKDNTKIFGDKGAAGALLQSEDYIIDRKEDISKWYEIKSEFVNKYKEHLKNLKIELDNNTCIINFRGGEYRSIPNVILRKEYWSGAINEMLKINPNMKFVIISDDPDCARFYMPFEIPCYHLDIGFDFYVVNQAKWLIISNSSFGWWAAWLNKNSNLTIAPKYWARHNASNGYWATGDIYTRCFKYLDRNNNLFSYEECKKEALDWYYKNNITISK